MMSIGSIVPLKAKGSQTSEDKQLRFTKHRCYPVLSHVSCNGFAAGMFLPIWAAVLVLVPLNWGNHVRQQRRHSLNMPSYSWQGMSTLGVECLLLAGVRQPGCK